MEYVHRCEFCGWSRAAGSAAIVAPLCERCGCGLSSLRQSELSPVQVSDMDELQRVLPQVDPGVRHALRIAFLVLITAAAARWGYMQGGPAIAVAAFGVAGMFAVPIAVPGRYGEHGRPRAAASGPPGPPAAPHAV